MILTTTIHWMPSQKTKDLIVLKSYCKTIQGVQMLKNGWKVSVTVPLHKLGMEQRFGQITLL